MDLRWEIDEKDKQRELYAGEFDRPLITLWKRTKWWEIVSWLPGLEAEKRFQPLEAAVAWAEAGVADWFAKNIKSSKVLWEDPVV